MLKKKLIPTPLIVRKGDTRTPLQPLDGGRGSFIFSLFVRVLWHLLMTKIRAPHGPGDKYTPQRLATLVRTDMERLGGLWIKAAQIIAMRRDIFPKVYCDELGHLHDRAVGFSGEVAVKIIEEELGAPVSDVFGEFDTAPIAAASIGQVHVGVLRECGRKVAVKVQRPNITQSMNEDFAIISTYVSFLSWFPSLRWLHLDEMCKHLEMTIADELDYRIEAGAVRRMRRTLKVGKVYAPRVFPKQSTRRVLTMEFIDGVLMSDFLQVLATDRKRAKRWCRENKINPKKFGERIYLDSLKQALHDNLAHGDLHPGNVMMLRKNRFALIDFGSISVLDQGYFSKFVIAVRCLAMGDFAKYVDVYLTLLSGVPNIDIDAMKKEAVQELEEWEAIADVKAVPYEQRSVLNGISRLSKVFVKYKLPPAWSILRVLRTMSALDASLIYLMPRANWFNLAMRHFQREQKYFGLVARSKASRQALIGTVIDVLKLPANLGENLLFQGEMVRKRAMSFQATISKAAEIGRAVAMTGVNLGLIATVIVGARYLSKQTDMAKQAVANLPVRDVFASIPALSPGMWLVVILFSLYTLMNLRKLANVLGVTGVAKNPFV